MAKVMAMVAAYPQEKLVPAANALWASTLKEPLRALQEKLESWSVGGEQVLTVVQTVKQGTDINLDFWKICRNHKR